jgi:hypothetical protein
MTRDAQDLPTQGVAAAPKFRRSMYGAGSVGSFWSSSKSSQSHQAMWDQQSMCASSAAMVVVALQRTYYRTAKNTIGSNPRFPGVNLSSISTPALSAMHYALPSLLCNACLHSSTPGCCPLVIGLSAHHEIKIICGPNQACGQGKDVTSLPVRICVSKGIRPLSFHFLGRDRP